MKKEKLQKELDKNELKKVWEEVKNPEKKLQIGLYFHKQLKFYVRVKELKYHAVERLIYVLFTKSGKKKLLCIPIKNFENEFMKAEDIKEKTKTEKNRERRIRKKIK